MKDLLDYVRERARFHGVDPELAARVYQTESGGNPTARSSKGAFGPMQLMPVTARDLGVDINDPYQNIDGGVRYLKQQLTTFNDPELALAAYNSGPGNVRKYGGIPPFKETQDYVKKTNGQQSKQLPKSLSFDQQFPELSDQSQNPQTSGDWSPLPHVSNQDMPIRNPNGKAMAEALGLPDWAQKMAGNSSAPNVWTGFADEGRTSGLQIPGYQDAGENLNSLIGLLLSGKLGGQISRKRVI